jgi:CheY-like chemotaxis protein
MHVLIVDDDQEIRETLRCTLEDEGHTIDEANDGLIALKKIRELQQPTVVLLDFMMPRLDGTGVLREIAQEPSLWSRFAFIIMTATTLRAFSLPSANLVEGITITIMQKPFDIDTLLSAIDAIGRTLLA